MAITKESNFPNSRITAALQAQNADDPNQQLFIQGQNVGGRSCLMVQIAQSSGSALKANANINEFQGMTDFNMANAFIPEGYDRIEIAEEETPTTAAYRFYKGIRFIAKLLITYTDATKQKTLRVQRVNAE